MTVSGSKVCTNCNTEKAPDQFYPCKRSHDGLESRCKDCRREAKRAWACANADRARAATRRWRSRNRKQSLSDARRWKQENREHIRDYARRWEKENADLREEHRKRYAGRYPEKIKAQRAVANAVRRGKLAKPSSCERCQKAVSCPRDLHGHHADYTKPLDVEWLCPPCHSAHHKELKEEHHQQG